MPYNPAGLFSLVASYFASPGASIRTEQHNPVFEDVASALSSVYLRDGRAPMTGDVNMNGFAINNVVAGNNPSSVATLAQAMPIGAVIDFAGNAAPAGWALCYGQAISRTTYATLFGLLGVAFGAGDGSTTFNLPDLRGRVAAGIDAMGGTAANRLPGYSINSQGGAPASTINQANLPNIALPGQVSDPGHQHTSNGPTAFQVPSGANGPIAGNYWAGSPAPNQATQPALTGISVITPLGGLNIPLPVIQPTIALSKIIRVSYDV